MPRQHETPIRGSLRIFLAVFLAIGVLLGGLAGVLSQSGGDALFRSIKDQERYVLGLQRQLIESEVQSVARDLHFLAGQHEVRMLADGEGGADFRHELANELLVLSHRAGIYDQLRYLDETGMERVRVNYNGGNPVVVPDDELQNKGGRYYFQDAFALGEGEIFVSPLDLNIEHGELELPHKPMIRFGTPVFDSAGHKRGIILINFLAQGMLDHIADMGLATLGNSMLVNADGYWLLSNDPEDEWGFMIKDRADRTFAARFPDEWERILGEVRGQFLTEAGLFTFSVVLPLQAGQYSSTGSPEAFAPSDASLASAEYHWFLVSYVPPDVVAEFTRGRLGTAFLTGAGTFVVLALAAWLLALLVTRRRIYRAQLESLAHYDTLTGLPNRILFSERLRLAHESAVRYDRQYGVVRLDLESGRPDKDGRGGDVDPEALVRVAGILRDALRRSDTVARLGGNSFAILLTELKGLESARAMGDRVVAVLCSPHCLGLGEDSPRASVGTAVYPDHAKDPEDLLLLAEQALSVAKTRGRNSSVLASS